MAEETLNFCSHCGHGLRREIPAGDSLYRYVCPACEKIHYQNPRLVVGTLPIWQNSRVLLCRRAINPRHGFWTVPAGFMENGESAEDGAARETREEANANIAITRVHTVYSIPHINQVYVLFLAELLDLDFYPGIESLEVRLFSESEIDWSELAFSSVRFALERLFSDLADQVDRTHTGIFEHNF